MSLNAFSRDARMLARQITEQYASNVELNGVVATLQPKADMVNYLTNANAAAQYASHVQLNAAVAPLATTAALNAGLASRITPAELDAALTPYLTQASAETTYSPKNRVVQYETPGVGDTVVVNADTDYLLLDSAGPLANITLDFPGSPSDQKRFTVASTKNLNAVTINAPGTLNNPVTNLVGGGAFEYMFRGNSNAWFRVK